MATTGLPHVCEHGAHGILSDRVGHKTTLHFAHVASSRHPRVYSRLVKPCAAQSIGSQAAVSNSEKDFQRWWLNADVKAVLSPADFEGTGNLTYADHSWSNTQPELTAQGFGACQLKGTSTLVTPSFLCHAQQPYL